MKQLRLEQLAEYTPLDQKSDFIKPWEVDPSDGRPTWLEITEDIEIETPEHIALLLKCMGQFAVKFHDHYGYQGYPVFRLEDGSWQS